MNSIRDLIEVTNGEPSEKIFILARSSYHVNEWCRTHGINPRSRNVRWVCKTRDLQGVNDSWFADLGTDNQDLRDLIETLIIARALKLLPVPNI